MGRMVEIWNSLAGVKPVTKFANRKVATERIWKALQGLGALAAAVPASEPRVGTIQADKRWLKFRQPSPALHWPKPPNQ